MDARPQKGRRLMGYFYEPDGLPVDEVSCDLEGCACRGHVEHDVSPHPRHRDENLVEWQRRLTEQPRRYGW